VHGSQRPALEEHLAWLERQIGEVDRALDGTLRASPAWQAKAALLRSIPGVGPVVAAALLGGLPELGTLDRHEAAALAGVAPLNRDSGTRSGPRHIWGGRAPVRTALYMAVVSGIRHNPAIRALYRRLHEQAGKPKKVAMVACMRKLLTIANALLRDGMPWSAEGAAHP
jgi:transposase